LEVSIDFAGLRVIILVKEEEKEKKKKMIKGTGQMKVLIRPMRP
jgi:hypothetical protein